MVIDFNRLNTGNSSNNTVNKPPVAQNQPPSSGTSAAPEAAPNKPAGSGESVQLSQQAQALKQAESRLNDLPSVDKERVERLKAAIADGSYSVDAKRVAQKLAAFETQR